MSPHSELRYAVLGPLLIHREAGPADLEAPKQRLLLAVFLTRPKQPIPTDVLVEALWDTERPAEPRKALIWHIMKLRQQLGGKDTIVWHPDGYLLATDEEDIDACRFQRLLRDATRRLTSDPRTAAGLLGEALDLWRGPAFGDLAEAGAVQEAARHLDELRLSALELCGDAELALGRHTGLVPELLKRVADNPFRERFLGQLMLALYRCGRRDEALRVLRDGRAQLAERLGLDPSPALRQLEQQILRDDPALTAEPTEPIPRQLPADVAGFTGREAEVTDLLSIEDVHSSDTLVLTAIDGLGGVGKTALAVHVAHRLAAEFPDGQLFIDLHGYSGEHTALAATDALDRMLRALGVSASQIPAEVDDRSALLRTVLSGRRILMVLDNAAGENQVRPLLPGGGHLVIVTSRHPLTGLDDARQVPLGILDRADAIELFTRVARVPRGRPDRELIADIVELCGRLPLALRIAASRLRNRPHWTLTELRERLTDDSRRVAELRSGDRHLDTSFRLSYRELDPEQRRAFRLLSAIPGADFGLDAAAVMLDRSRENADDLLITLADSRLLETSGPERYTFHDLVRLYGRQSPDEGGEVPLALNRLRAWYRAAARAAETQLGQHSPLLDNPGNDIEVSFAGYDDAIRWCDAEQHNITSVVRESAGTGHPRECWLLVDAMKIYHYQRVNLAQWREIAEIGLTAAHRHGDAAARAAMLHNLGSCAVRAAEYREALVHFGAALVLARSAGDAHRQHAILIETASGHMHSGDTRAAIKAARQAQSLVDSFGSGNPVAALGILGACHCVRGELRKAVAATRLCVRRKRLISSKSLQDSLGNLSISYLAMGRHDDARAAAQEGLTIGRSLTARGSIMSNLDNLARIDLATGDTDAAELKATEALRLCDEINARGSRPYLLATLALARLRGRPGQARRLAHEALAAARELGSNMAEAETLVVLAESCMALGAPEAAREHATRARELARNGEYGILEGRATTILAEAAARTGDEKQARQLAEEALELQHRTGNRPGAERSQRCLDALGSPRRVAR